MTKTVYVGNLAPETSAESLRALFAAKGHEVQAVKLATHRKNSRPRGFGFVELASEEDAAAALTSLAGATIDGRELKVGAAVHEKHVVHSATLDDDYGGSGGRFGSRGGSGGKRGRR